MKILFVSSECAPFSKSGGLADVAFSLPPALQKTGDDMAIVTPMYRVTQENDSHNRHPPFRLDHSRCSP